MKGLNLLVLRSADIDAARRFYECFGMTFERHRHGDGPEHFGAEGPAGVFEIYPAGANGPDCAGLGFAAQDLAATSDRLRAAGFEPGDITEQPWGTTFVVRDPDGRRVEVQAA